VIFDHSHRNGEDLEATWTCIAFLRRLCGYLVRVCVHKHWGFVDFVVSVVDQLRFSDARTFFCKRLFTACIFRGKLTKYMHPSSGAVRAEQKERLMKKWVKESVL
jgi:hypothetical protein